MSVPEYASGMEGKALFGSVEQDITQWDGTWAVDLDRFGTSKTGGWKTDVAGNHSASGTITGKVPEGGDTPDEGDIVALTLQGGGPDRSGNARLENVQVTVDVTSGKAVEWKANWASRGAWVKAAASAGSTS